MPIEKNGQEEEFVLRMPAFWHPAKSRLHMARNAWLLIYYRRASGQRQGSLSKPVASLHFLSCVISHDNSGREGKKLERKGGRNENRNSRKVDPADIALQATSGN